MSDAATEVMRRKRGGGTDRYKSPVKKRTQTSTALTVLSAVQASLGKTQRARECSTTCTTTDAHPRDKMLDPNKVSNFTFCVFYLHSEALAWVDRANQSQAGTGTLRPVTTHSNAQRAAT